MTEEKFIEKWKTEIANTTNTDRQTLDNVIANFAKSSGSPFIRDHLYGLLSTTSQWRAEKLMHDFSIYPAAFNNDPEQPYRYFKDEINFENGFNLVTCARFMEDELKVLGSDKTMKGDIRTQVTGAIQFYRKAIDDFKFEGSHPYDRLVILYKRYKYDSKETVHVLKKAIKQVKQANKKAKYKEKLEKFLDKT